LRKLVLSTGYKIPIKIQKTMLAVNGCGQNYTLPKQIKSV